MVKLGPFLLACSFIACIIAWRFFSDSSRRLDKKIGFFVFFLYISNVAYIIFYMLANVLSLFLHVTLLLLLCKRKEKLLLGGAASLARIEIKKKGKREGEELTDFTLATLFLLLLFLSQSLLLVRASDLALRLLLLREKEGILE